MPNPEDITDPTTVMNMALVLMAKAFKLNYSTPTNNNQIILSNPRNRQIAQPGMNMGQDRQMQMVGVQNVRNQVFQNAVQNLGVQNVVGNQNGLIVVPGIANQNANQNRNGNVVAARAEDLDEIEEVNANYILMANLQQASTSGTQADKALVYDSNGSAKVHEYDNCYNNDIFNIFTQEEQYIELLEPIPEPHQVQQNDSNVISEVSSMEQSRGTVEKHPATVEETRAYFESLYNNLAIEVEKVNSVNRKMKETNADLTTELARYKNQEKCFEISQEKYDKLERCYQKSVYQEQCLTKKINALHLSSHTSNLQTELDRTKERFENCIIKKENEYAKLWNDWYKKCEECKYDKISYDKAYNDMQQKIERLQAQLGDQKGKSKDTPCVSNTLDPLSQKLENENVELEFQVSEQKDTTKGISVNTQFCKHSVLGKPPSSSKPKLYVVTPFPKSKGMFRINPFKPYREEKHVPKKVRASVRTNPITVSQLYVITKKDVNSDSNGLSSTGVDNTAKTRRPQPRNNTKNDRVPSASKSSCSKNKEVEVEKHPRNLLLSKNKKHMSSECNNVKLAIQNDKSEVVCAMCKQCLITANHDVCVLNYVNDMHSRGKKQKANVSNTENQKKQKPKVMKPKKVGSNERLASPKPSKPRSCLRWSPTRRLFNLKGKIIASSESKNQSDCSNGYPNLFMFLGTVRFGNDHVAAILGFGDLQWGNILITRVYFVEGLGHNLFSVGQFCDSDLEDMFFAYECDFMILEDTTSIIDRHLGEMAFGRPFIDETGLVYDKEEGTVMFKQDDEKITFKMPHTMEIFKETRLMGLSTDSIPTSAYEEIFSHGRTHYYQSLFIEDEYMQDEGDRRGIRHLIRLEREMMRDKGEVT
ncbi:hypothetical protein Tco_0830068 [Tanacetum coccineum]